MMSATATTQFFEIAKPLIAMNIPVTPVRPGTKRAFLPDFPTTASTSLEQIEQWAQAYPDHNAACVARAEAGGVFFWEVDSPDVWERLQKDTGHDGIAELQTFKVRSRAGRGHFYFAHTPETIARLSNLSQSYVKVKGGDWSLRVNREYVVSPGSTLPDRPEPYKALNPGTPIAEAPKWLIDWLLSQKIQKQSAEGKDEAARNDAGLVSHGSIHGFMLTQAGKLRAQGLGEESIRVALRELVEKNCAPPIDWDKVDTMAKSICNFPEGQNKALVLNQQMGQPAPSQETVGTGIEVIDGITYALISVGENRAPRRVALDTRSTAARPKFPDWVMVGTSLFENLVKPAVETSSKYPELIFVPAMQLMMNYLSRKVQIELHPTDLNMFVGLVTPFGEYFKSSSCKLGHDYFAAAGISKKYGKDTKVGEGKVLISQAGSPEGFGIQMQRVNANNAILFFDELGKLVSKAGIEGSGFSSDLLTWYGGEDFGNMITNAKNNFSFPAGTYTFGWLWCTTDRNFNHYWPKLAGIASGIEDRMFFLVAPEKPKPAGLYHDPVFGEGPLKTRMLMEKALTQKTFQIEDGEAFKRRAEGLDPRSLNLMVKLSLFFAIDLGLDIVDDDCAERARALVDYRNRASAFLEPIEAENSEGRLQKEIVRELRQNGGRMPYRDLQHNLDHGRFGSRAWNGAVYGLVNQGDVVHFQERRTQGKRATHMVGLVRHEDDFDDDTGEPKHGSRIDS